MPFHELLRRYLMGGAAYFDTADPATHESDPPKRRRASSEDDDDDDGVDPDEPIADLKAARRRLGEYEKYTQRLRKESANKRAANKDLQTQLAEANQKLADLQKKYDTDTETLKADHVKAVQTAVDAALAERDQKTKGEKIADALRDGAKKHGAKDVDDLLKIVDASVITIDDKGAVAGVDKLIEDTKKAKPHLFGATTTSSTDVTPSPSLAEGVDLMKMDDKDVASEFAKLGVRL